MKNIKNIIYLLAVVGFIATSCDEDAFLHEVNPNAISADIFWENQGDAEAALTTVYGALQFYTISGAGLGFSNLRSDMYATNTFTPWVSWNDLNISDNHALIGQIYAEPYIGIFRANQLINNLPDIDDPNFDEEDKNAIMAQAKFLRAVYYFKTTNDFGGAVLTTSASGLKEDIHLPFSTIQQVTDSVIIPDLEFAVANLPKKWEGENLGRATWGAAKAMLGKTYLYNKEFEKAAKEFEELLAEGLYSLVPDPLDNFKQDTEFNAESIFEVPFNAEYNGGTPNNLAFQVDNTAGGSGTETVNITRFYVPEALGGYRTLLPTYFAHEVILSDSISGSTDHSSRINASIAPSNFEGLYYNKTSADYPTKPWSFGETAYIKKYTNWNWQENEGGQGRSSINYRMIRLADVYLMYAEALLSQATPDVATAIVYIDNVRKRAGVVTLHDYIDANGTIPQLHVSREAYGSRPEVTPTAANVLTHLRMVERPIELCFEGSRWNDLVRWGIVREMLDEQKKVEDIRVARFATNGGSGDNAAPLFIRGTFRLDYVNNVEAYNSATHDYLPIPTLEIQLNNGL
ncbi:RagB/SusD family nutrient uptake outer membrane protein [Reichenbachiella carrageenanivorans]|uniref:RagB/SusD family nutrient uptake outer membrane protein n=1 Tax=Reichenbachiella carrageenanivorans TaxID=2979869 RepID=A0ABY6CZN4_9BACT|nr:RagB/SusD family nutrient uptake outer membrane protein [Reichenbachiella carrageenanivorans]UXX79376.1 RagB/SusD family nutrient uptake outer membrane protein [Reichenbachiella carrageenanivorans]